MRIDYYVFSSKGGRERNEDAAFVKAEEYRGIFLVADGLGGHKDGNLASQGVVASLHESWEALGEQSFTREWIEHSIQKANEDLLAMQAEAQSNMRSTLAMLLIDGEKSAWANVGDSRVYYLRDGELARITEDHSMAFLKFKAGDILRSELAKDPDQSRLLRSLGNRDRNSPDIIENTRTIKAGDAFMLCSDGVWEYITDLEVMIDYLKSSSASEWAKLMLLRLMERVQRGNDNLSIITVWIQ